MEKRTTYVNNKVSREIYETCEDVLSILEYYAKGESGEWVKKCGNKRDINPLGIFRRTRRTIRRSSSKHSLNNNKCFYAILKH